MVTPVFANPLRREVVIDFGDRYEKGHLWFGPCRISVPPGSALRRGWMIRPCSRRYSCLERRRS